MELFGERLDIEKCGRRSGSASPCCSDTSKLWTLTGFEAEVALKDGLARTIEWYVAHSLSVEA